MAKERPAQEPAKVWSQTAISKEEVVKLGKTLRDSGVSTRTRILLAKLANMPPPIRLSVNLKTLMNLMIKERVRNVLTEGLTPDEHSALVELDVRGLPSTMREVAHGLLNVHERWQAMKALGRMFRESHSRRNEFKTFDDLNDVLGG